MGITPVKHAFKEKGIMSMQMIRVTRASALASGVAIGVCLLASGAAAGGFSRAEADTDILFTQGTVSLRSGAFVVSPSRGYATLMGEKANDGDYADSFWGVGVALKAKLGDNLSCALTPNEPFGASATYGEGAQNAEFLTATAQGILANPTTSMSFDSKEYAGTCAVRIPVGPGNFYAIGGAFYQTFDYREDTWLGNVRLKDKGEWGYRLGAAYDVPDYAMRFQLLYRSAVEHTATGVFTPSDLAAGLGIIDPLSAVGGGKLPQSLKLSAQTGVAPGWLVYGSVLWTDWSVLPSFDYTVSNLASSHRVFNYKDGYTVQVGVGHEFTDALSGTVNLTWDQGVGSGADITTDTWTVGLGAEYKTSIGTFGAGAALSYLTGGSQSALQGATYDATAKGDWAVAGGLTYLVEF